MLTPPVPPPGAELRNLPVVRNAKDPSVRASKTGVSPFIGPQLRTMMNSPLLGASVYLASSVVPD